jgi:peroxiredoxin Q/BCP
MNDDASPTLPSVGQPAPPLALPDDTGVIRDLASARGRWVVLFFYPKDDTPGCTLEACEFRDLGAPFAEVGAEVWGISILDSASKAAFKRKHGLTFPLLADEDHAVAERYGVWVEKVRYGRRSMGIQRATVLVDPDGRVAHVWPRVTPEGHPAEVLETLRSLATAAGGPGVTRP